jgi:deoxyadenosine/deoxycytidine kinase
MTVPVLIITGPVGVGKTTVALEVNELLRARGVLHAVVDLDSLAWVYPTPPGDPYNNGLAFRNLAAVWANYAAAGAQRLVLARVVTGVN